MKKPIFFLLMLLFALSACSPADDDRVQFNPTIAVDDVCAGLLNNTFVTRENLQTSDENDVQILTPYRVSFLLDGRVVWNYENNASYIGIFTCEGGSVTATFEEGSQKEFRGQFDPDTGSVVIDEVTYLVDTDI